MYRIDLAGSGLGPAPTHLDKEISFSDIPGFRREVDDIGALMGY
jgi:hypothetical protein